MNIETITVREILEDFIILPMDAKITELEELSLEVHWDGEHGYYKFNFGFKDGGSAVMPITPIHPNVVCEGNPCKYCGHAVHEKNL